MVETDRQRVPFKPNAPTGPRCFKKETRASSFLETGAGAFDMIVGGDLEMMNPDDDPYGGDVLLRDCVERALAPHLGRLSAEKLDAMRDYLITFVTTHPAAEPLYARLRSRPQVAQSTLVERMQQRDVTQSPAKASSKRAR